MRTRAALLTRRAFVSGLALSTFPAVVAAQTTDALRARRKNPSKVPKSYTGTKQGKPGDRKGPAGRSRVYEDACY